MCDFHSTCWRLLGQEIQVAHNQKNSHSGAIQEAGWRENEPNRRINVFEAEWNGIGEMPPDSKLIRNSDECPEKLVKAIRSHYIKLNEALTTGKHVLAGGYFSSEKWLDVLVAAVANGMSVAFPERVGGSLYLGGLTSAKGLVLPKSIGGSLDLCGLTSANGLVLPKSIGGSLYFSGLTSAKDLVLPKSIGGSLYLRGLTSAKDLVLPKSIGGSLYLGGLTSAKDLVLPQSVGGSLDLSGLTSAKGLVLPKSVGDSLCLMGLTSADKDALRKKFPHLKNKIV